MLGSDLCALLPGTARERKSRRRLELGWVGGRRTLSSNKVDRAEEGGQDRSFLVGNGGRLGEVSAGVVGLAVVV